MKLSKRTLLHVSILFFICLGFISSTLAVQPGWTKKQVTRELGKPDNIVTDHDLGETWTYNDRKEKKRFFSSLSGTKLGLNFANILKPKPSGIGYKISRGANSTSKNKKRGSTYKSKKPDTASAFYIHFDTDGRVTEPGIYHQTPDISTEQKQIKSGEPLPITVDDVRPAKINEIVVKGPKHVYVDNKGVCHRPYCRKIIGIEKQTMQRFETLEQALEDKNEKCDSCITLESKKVE